ncbi:hypothetical protein DBB29_00770 [Pandoraea cepalis]|uniref:DUF2489 domain-containing protein n=1 Tax=Pandoraea cepalis TaxID=2508294 RepID=A0AAW7MH41_9BURK|nr:hypothetical protein [Pandoraea cepalis]MDN4572015.1 hypothetical protein [Pandoraea cepalis]MDN4576666.1 hypothetical protein [Pandoraea cepalis]
MRGIGVAEIVVLGLRIACGIGVLYVLIVLFRRREHRTRAQRLAATMRNHDQAAAAQVLLCHDMVAWLDDEILKEKISPRDGHANSEWLRCLNDAQREVTFRLLELSERGPGVVVNVERKYELNALWDRLREAK